MCYKVPALDEMDGLCVCTSQGLNEEGEQRELCKKGIWNYFCKTNIYYILQTG